MARKGASAIALAWVWLLALGAAGPAGAVSLPPLHADPDPEAGGRIVDARGREVLLRGVNVNALAEYWRGGPFRTVFPLRRGDPRLMAGIGWNAVRLLVSWSRIEPRPGRYAERYLDRIAATIRRLRGHGIYWCLSKRFTGNRMTQAATRSLRSAAASRRSRWGPLR